MVDRRPGEAEPPGQKDLTAVAVTHSGITGVRESQKYLSWEGGLVCLLYHGSHHCREAAQAFSVSRGQAMQRGKQAREARRPS